MQASNQDRVYWFGALFSFILPFAVFLFTICPGLYWRDAPELAMTPFLLDISHPPGAPTYSLIGKLFSFIPLGGIALKANLLSALFGGLFGLMTYLLIVRLGRLLAPRDGQDRLHHWLNIGLASMFAVLVVLSPDAWYWSVAAEVYSLMLFIMALCLYLAVRLLEDDAENRSYRPLVWSCLLALISGLGAGVHPNLILFLPPVVLFLIWDSWKRRTAGSFWLWPFFLLAGLLVYLYLPVRSFTPLAYDYGNPETVSQFISHLTARSYAQRVYHFPLTHILTNWARVPGLTAEQLGLIPALFGLYGLIVILRRRWELGLLIILMAAGNLWLVKDWTAAFGYLPVFFAWSVLAAMGALDLAHRVYSRFEGRIGRVFSADRLGVIVLLVVLLVCALHVRSGWAWADKSGHLLTYRLARASLNVLPEESVLISAQDHLSFPLHYLQYVANYRTDVAHIHNAYVPFPAAIKQRWPELEIDYDNFEQGASPLSPFVSLLPQRPLYLDRTELTSDWIPAQNLIPQGIFYRVSAEPAERLTETQLGIHGWLMINHFESIMNDPWFNEADWTARRVFSSIHNNLGAFFYERSYPGLTEAAFQRARKICPECLFAYNNLGTLYLAQKRYDPAGQMLESGLALQPQNEELLSTLAKWAKQTEQLSVAEQTYRKILKINPNRDRERLALAGLLFESGQISSAVKHCESIWNKSADKQYRLEAGLMLVAVFGAEQEWTKALALLDRIDQLAPDNPEAKSLREKLLARQNPQ